MEVIKDEEITKHGAGARRDIILEILRARGYSLGKVFECKRNIARREWQITVYDKEEVPADANVLMYL